MILKRIVLFLFIGIFVISFISSSQALTHRERFNQDYKHVVAKLKYSGCPGPLSKELAKVALARQVLEDGPNRHEKESIAGISIGGFNKVIVESTLPKHISIHAINDSNGDRFYHFKGSQAPIYSALIISRLFDYYINKFMKSERKSWFLAKETSHAIHQDPDSMELNFRFYNKLDPVKIIEKADKFYGPNHQSVVNIYSR